jgi:ATP-dependent Clp protease protease subunit
MRNKKFWKWTNRTVPRASNQEDAGQEPETVERVLTLNGTIAEDSWFDDDVTPQMFKDELNAGSGDVTVWINSPGGDCVAAAQIYNMLSEYPGKVTVKIDGLAASAASVIAMAGDTVMMSPVSMMMIHNPATVAWGDHTEMQKAIELLDAVKESIINAYVMKSGLSRARLSHLMDAETWMDANKAVELGFADGILYAEDDAADAGGDGAGEGGSASVDDTAGTYRRGSGNGRDYGRPDVSTDSVMFSRRAVNNALVNKLEAKYGKPRIPAEKQTEIQGLGQSCTGVTDNVQNLHVGSGEVNKVTGQNDSGLDNGRSADELRERLNFIKKFI